MMFLQHVRRRVGTTLAISLALWVVFASAPPSLGDVVITEVLYDTVGVEFGATIGEWIEIYNTGPSAVDLSGWSIEKDDLIDGVAADPLFLIQGSSTLQPGQFALIFPAGDAAVSTPLLIETWAIPDCITVFGANWTGSHNLSNSGELIALRDAFNFIADITSYPDLGTNIGSVQIGVFGMDAATNDDDANWVQSSTGNADFCVDPVSAVGADFGYIDNSPANDFWDGPEENRDLGTPGRFPKNLEHTSRYSVDHGAPLLLDRDLVRNMVLTAVILPSGNADELCAYDFPSPFPAGSRISASDGVAPVAVFSGTTWVVWLDDDPFAEFTHATRLVLVDDATGAITVLSSGWWPEMNCEPFYANIEDRMCSPNNFWGNCCGVFELRSEPARSPVAPGSGLDEDVQRTAVANNACAIGISGSKESHFTKNVNNFIKGLVDAGLVDEARTKKVLYPKSRLRTVCKAIELLPEDLPDDCDKLYIYIATHGGRNFLNLPGPNLTARKLAKKLKDKGVADNCVVIQACQSGSFIDELKGAKIPGTVTTSADKRHTSYFKRGEYSYYTNFILECLKLTSISTLKEAAAWAKIQLANDRPKDKSNPQCEDLSSIGIVQTDGGGPAETGTKGEGFSHQFEAEGIPAGSVTWSMDPPGIAPPGLTLTLDGQLSGVLEEAGQFDYVIRFTDCCTPNEATLLFTLTVTDPLPDAPSPLHVDTEFAPGLIAVDYNFPISISGGTPPYTVEIIEGSLPPEMLLDQGGATAGLTAGILFTEFSSDLTIQVIDNGLPDPQIALRNMVFSVTQGNPPPCPPSDPVVLKRRKLRHLAFTAGNPGLRTGIRVTMKDLPPPFDIGNGTIMWVGGPKEICQNSGQSSTVLPAECAATLGKLGFPAQLCLGGNNDGVSFSNSAACEHLAFGCIGGACSPIQGPTLLVSKLVPDPFFTDWSTFDREINIGGEFIVPSSGTVASTYVLDVMEESCNAEQASSFSPPVEIVQPIWGDAVGLSCLTFETCSPPDGSVGITSDVSAILEMFKNSKFAPGKASTDVEPSLLDDKINFTDVVQILGAFSSQPYPFAPAAFHSSGK